MLPEGMLERDKYYLVTVSTLKRMKAGMKPLWGWGKLQNAYISREGMVERIAQRLGCVPPFEVETHNLSIGMHTRISSACRKDGALLPAKPHKGVFQLRLYGTLVFLALKSFETSSVVCYF